jgi:ATP-binding cassette subfamily A (ABC1) protein 3
MWSINTKEAVINFAFFLKLFFWLIFKSKAKTFAYSNLYTNIFDDKLNIGGVLASMIGWTIIYIPIAWYIERIFPGEYGAPLPFYFPFMVNIKH